jgi:NAD(P)-dependent dehydrogenase (short-subunit alcohol dehydrogenase family)
VITQTKAAPRPTIPSAAQTRRGDSGAWSGSGGAASDNPVGGRLFGLVAVIQAVLPSMCARRAGHIILISSMGGHVSLPTMTAYTSSKLAVEGVGEGLAKELAPLGINVTIAEPVGFGTSFAANARQAADPIEDYEPARQAMREFAAGAVRGGYDAWAHVTSNT